MFEEDINDNEKQNLIIKLNETLKKLAQKETENSILLKEMELLRLNQKENNFPLKNNILNHCSTERNTNLKIENNKLKEQLNQLKKKYNNLLLENNKQKIENEKLKEKLIYNQNKNTEKKNPIFQKNEQNLESNLNNNYLDQIFNLQIILSKKNEDIRILKEKNEKLQKIISGFKMKQKQTERNKNNNNKNIADLNETVLVLPTPSLRKLKTMMNKTERKNTIKAKILNTEENKDIKFIFENEKEVREKINQLITIKNNFFQKFVIIKKKSNNFYNEIKKQDNYISNYKTYINELSAGIIKIRDQLNVSIMDIDEIENNSLKMNKLNEFSDSLESISLKIRQYSDIVIDCENKIKKIENIQGNVQESFNMNNKTKGENYLKNLLKIKQNLEITNHLISLKIKTLENILNELDSEILSFKNKQKDIEENFAKLQKEYQEFIRNAEKDITTRLSIISKKTEKIENSEIDNKFEDSIFFKDSMLLEINDFGKRKDLFISSMLFNDKNIKITDHQDLIQKNWNEVCYIYDDYDIHDVHYDLMAVNLPQNMYYIMSSFGFYYDTIVEIIDFEIDGKKSKYNYQNYLMKFDINLKNLEMNKIHLKYKESILPSKFSSGEQKQRKFIKNGYYGINKNKAGQTAKFTLSIKCDFEIINFEEEIFLKTKDNEYIWGGEVPPEGKTTNIIMSKKKGKYNFNINETIESLDNSFIKDTKFTLPFSFIGGNNYINKIELKSNQTNLIEKNEEKKQYEIIYKDTNSTIGDFLIFGELENYCKGEWKCDLTDEEIESHIPEDYIKNKKQYNKIANEIIKQYDENHKNDLIKLKDIAKIGKWVNKNIKYDINYTGRNDITAIEIYNTKVGVCHHYTILFNALIYSLGYKVIFIEGLAMNKKDNFNQEEDGHAWSLIKVDGQWLPFDATWGFFSGKLPVSHVFLNYFERKKNINTNDNVIFGNGTIEGNYVSS